MAMSTVAALEALLQDQDVSEIMVDGPDQVYVERHGKLEETAIKFADAQAVINWANGLLTANGWTPVGEDRPWAEGRLPSGDLVVVVIPPIALNGPNVVINKLLNEGLTLEKLMQFGSINQTFLDFMQVVMCSRLNILVSGGTSSGKTTLMNRIIELAPPAERLVVVERPHELRIGRIAHDRLVYLEVDEQGGGGRGTAEMRDLLRLGARMRPDRLIVGELVGAEALEILQLMNTGHDGMVSMIHANNPADALSRLETMVTIVEPSLSLPVIRAQIASALDLVIQQTRLEDGSRKVVSIVAVQGLKGDSLVLQELFTWQKTGQRENGRLSGLFKSTGVTPSFVPELAAAGLTFPDGLFEAS